MASVQLLDQALIDRTLQLAREAPRGRANHNFHAGAADNPHRFINALTVGTYCAPHRHIAPPKAESFVVLRGEVLVVLFTDLGHVSERHALGRGGLVGIDIPAGAWHTIAALTETAVCFEVKAGPWDPASDKEFAPWAPREGDPRAPDALSGWLDGLLSGAPRGLPEV
jgi:cupin fold WbuC family metalloprotein